MKVGMSRYNMQSGCRWKDMYFQEVGLFYFNPLALRNFIFLVSNPNSGLYTTKGASSSSLPKEFQL